MGLDNGLTRLLSKRLGPFSRLMPQTVLEIFDHFKLEPRPNSPVGHLLWREIQKRREQKECAMKQRMRQVARKELRDRGKSRASSNQPDGPVGGAARRLSGDKDRRTSTTPPAPALERHSSVGALDPHLHQAIAARQSKGDNGPLSKPRLHLMRKGSKRQRPNPNPSTGVATSACPSAATATASDTAGLRRSSSFPVLSARPTPTGTRTGAATGSSSSAQTFQSTSSVPSGPSRSTVGAPPIAPAGVPMAVDPVPPSSARPWGRHGQWEGERGARSASWSPPRCLEADHSIAVPVTPPRPVEVSDCDGNGLVVHETPVRPTPPSEPMAVPSPSPVYHSRRRSQVNQSGSGSHRHRPGLSAVP
eukprot:NODE_743_length_1209_cov_7.293966_g596_i0.p1 GENE.NODE_743_length_1209_cov_7.293966_g596_i0~~NODE_743_length_1209_cov_7.293966_g596_i0.p1  ORF type:complete len:362 (-),score=13.46 NODE_743_length_1209_cov_7.293966_g596_i0:106-1191(-)